MKRFPSLKDLLGTKKKLKVQTPAQIEAGLKRMFGLKRRDPWPQPPSAP